MAFIPQRKTFQVTQRQGGHPGIVQSGSESKSTVSLGAYLSNLLKIAYPQQSSQSRRSVSRVVQICQPSPTVSSRIVRRHNRGEVPSGFLVNKLVRVRRCHAVDRGRWRERICGARILLARWSRRPERGIDSCLSEFHISWILTDRPKSSFIL
jgi:hypothetical protein